MEKKDSAVLALTILLGILVQVIFSAADSCQTPGKTAIAFSKAYYKLDPSTTEFLCSDIADDEDFVPDGNIYSRVQDAAQRGFGAAYAKSALFEITTHTIEQSEDSATVELKAHRRTAINPVFFIVAKLFNLGKTYTVDETIRLVREEGQWKVCGIGVLPMRS